MGKTVQDIMTLIREQDIKMVDFKMVDIHGQFRHVTVLMRPTMAMQWWKRAIWCLSQTRILRWWILSAAFPPCP